MNFKSVRPLIAVLGFVFCAHNAGAQDSSAQNSDSHGNVALRVYYADLNETLSNFELDDVPFERLNFTVQPGDSLLEIARQQRFRELDFYHLAAAIFETNSQAFEQGDPALIKVGATIKLPTVGDLFVAQYRYERLKVVGDALDFTNDENQMSAALRWPFGKSLVMIGPHAKDELPSNQEVTLTSYRPDVMSTKGGGATDFLSIAAQASDSQVAGVGSVEPKKYNSWLDQSEEIALPVAESFPVVEADSTRAVAPVKWKFEKDTYSSNEPELEDGNSFSLDSLLVDEAVTEPVVFPDVLPEVIVVPIEDAVLEAESGLIASAVTQAVVPTAEVISLPVQVSDQIIETDVKQVVQAKVVDKPVQIEDPEIETIVVAAVATTNVINAKELDKQRASPPVIDAAALNTVDKTPVAMVDTAIVRDPNPATTGAEKEFYLGAPRDAATPSSIDIPTDPLSYDVEWSFDASATVGTALTELASYIGYELITAEDVVLKTYTRRLPGVQLRVNGISAEEGFSILAGRGLETVYNHVARTVQHVPRKSRVEKPLTTAKNDSFIHSRFVQQTGITALIKQFPADIRNAAVRHAGRCDSSANTNLPSAQRMVAMVVENLTRKAPALVTQNLVSWYDSPTGSKVLELEKAEINDAKLQKFSVSADRMDRIEQIYNNTVTGKGIAGIAVELDFAGWVLSGCEKQAERSGDVQRMQEEMAYGQNIRKKSVKLESILRGDMLRSTAYLFSSLSERELTEYAEITQEHVGIYSELQQSTIDAIKLETRQLELLP